MWLTLKVFFQKLLSVGVCSLNCRGKIFADCLWLNDVVCKPSVFRIKLFFCFATYDKAIFYESIIKLFGISYNSFSVYINKLSYNFIRKLFKTLCLSFGGKTYYFPYLFLSFFSALLYSL